jgi:hypothetical protein
MYGLLAALLPTAVKPEEELSLVMLKNNGEKTWMCDRLST